MGDQEHGQPQGFLQRLGQPVERVGGDRIEPGGGFIEEQQFRIERQGAGQTGALAHAARQFGRILAARVFRQAREHHLEARNLVQQLPGEFGIEFLQRHLDVFGHGQGRKQRTALEQHAPARADINVVIIVGPGIGHRTPEHFDRSGSGLLQPDDRAHQHRFTGARAADDAQNLAPVDGERKVFVNDVIAERGAQPRDDNGVFGHPAGRAGRCFVVRRHPFSPSQFW